MRTALAALLLAGALHSPGALAQYQNRSIGLSAGYWDLREEQGLDFAFPVGLRSTWYFDHGFEGVLHAIGTVARESITRDSAFGFSLQAGARYLFIQGAAFRPYVALHASYFHVFPPEGSTTRSYVGLGTHLGAEYFVAEAVSVGLRAEYNWYFQLNQPLQEGPGINLDVSFWY